MPQRTTTDDIVIDAVYVKARLEEAGGTLMALPAAGMQVERYRVAWPEIMQAVEEAYGYTPEEIRPSVPSARRIDEMDEVYFRWMPLVGELAVQTKRLMWLRSFIHPISGKYRYPWRRLEKSMGLNRETLVLRFGRGVDRIVTRLNRPSWVETESNRLP